jgi:hypothetical protein
LLAAVLIIAVFWYALVPVAGTFISRHRWRAFRERFAYICGKPPLDYSAMRQNLNGEHYFIGSFEAVTGNTTLWVKNDSLTAPVLLKNAQTYMVPLGGKKRRTMTGEKLYADADANDFDAFAEDPHRLNWNRISALTAGAKVFIGGALRQVDGQTVFTALKGHPLLVIFYECSERALGAGVLRAGRYRNEYWNQVTPYALVGGFFSLVWIALTFFARPVYRTVVLSATAALFGPLVPFLPPGLVFTLFYRHLWQHSCLYKVFRDAVTLPLKYLTPEYVCRKFEGQPSCEAPPPRLIPAAAPEKNETWYVSGVLKEDAGQVTGAPSNPFMPYGLIPGSPKVISRIYNRNALLFEIASWSVLAAGIALNTLFAELIIYFFTR